MPTGETSEVKPPEHLDDAGLNALFKEMAGRANGLNSAAAKNRLAKYGPNALAEKRERPLLKFLGHFRGPIPWMIELAAVLSAIVGHWVDLTIILVMLVFNAVVGFGWLVVPLAWKYVRFVWAYCLGHQNTATRSPIVNSRPVSSGRCLARSSVTAEYGDSRHNQFIGGQPMISNQQQHLPRGVLIIAWNSTNPAEIESLKTRSRVTLPSELSAAIRSGHFHARRSAAPCAWPVAP